jgi:L-arabinokinase
MGIEDPAEAGLRTGDLDAFLDTARAWLEPGTPAAIARAPGRLDVMGGIADYSGSLVLQKPIAEATFAAVQRIESPILDLFSAGRPPETIPLSALTHDGVPVSYDAARRMFSRGNHWAAYVAGVLLVLARERSMPLVGLRVLISSNVPEGKGVSSSAAVETATMRAASDAVGLDLDPRDIALLCQKAENLVAGAPCGVMDQMTCVFGEEDRLLALLCQPATLAPSVPIPGGIEFWGLDSGERHAVGGSDYGAVRTGAFMGLRILSEHSGMPLDYLANITPEVFERELAAGLSEELSGDEFLERYGGTADTVTAVERGRRYRVRAAAAHPIYERRRAEEFRQLLHSTPDDNGCVQLGALMYGSHEGYVACGLGSDGTNLLVDLVRTEGAAQGLYGARITGGGSGGTVAVIGRKDAAAAVVRVADAYERVTGYRPYVFSGSSPGVLAFGRHSVRR